MSELNPDREAIRSDWCERIKARIKNPLAKVAIVAAEFIGERTEPFDMGDYEENWE